MFEITRDKWLIRLCCMALCVSALGLVGCSGNPGATSTNDQNATDTADDATLAEPEDAEPAADIDAPAEQDAATGLPAGYDYADLESYLSQYFDVVKPYRNDDGELCGIQFECDRMSICIAAENTHDSDKNSIVAYYNDPEGGIPLLHPAEDMITVPTQYGPLTFPRYEVVTAFGIVPECIDYDISDLMDHETYMTSVFYKYHPGFGATYIDDNGENITIYENM